MTQIPYYPGCTLNTVAKAFDDSARASAAQLGIELKELSQWNCCGAAFPLTPDNLIGLAGPTNVLLRAQAAGGTVSTLCSFCYNTLKRTNRAFEADPEKLEVLNDFLEDRYEGKVEVLHLLEVLRDRLGFDALKGQVSRPLKKLKVAAYYGCMLLRPPGVGIDHPEQPSVFEDFLKALGCKPVDFPQRGECCGAHLAMSREDIVERLSGGVLESAKASGADLVVTSCPLCFHNLERSQAILLESHGGWVPIPVLYFSQILGLALGQDPHGLGIGENRFSAQPLLREKGLLEPVAA